MTVTTHPRWLSVCNIADPATGLESKFSYRHAAALQCKGYDTSALHSFSDALAQDAALGAFRQKVVVQADEVLPETAAVVDSSCKTGRPDA